MSRECMCAALLLLAGCPLTQKGKALDVRWYTPEHASTGRACQQAATGHVLRLGRVRSGPDLEERIVHGDGAYEVGYYEDRRWTERPERYVVNALNRTLFEECGFQRALESNAPTLDVDVLIFQEVKMPQAHATRIALRVVLSVPQVLLQETITAVEPVVGERFDDVVAALSRALDAASEQVARRAGESLSLADRSRK